MQQVHRYTCVFEGSLERRVDIFLLIYDGCSPLGIKAIYVLQTIKYRTSSVLILCSFRVREDQRKYMVIRIVDRYLEGNTEWLGSHSLRMCTVRSCGSPPCVAHVRCKARHEHNTAIVRLPHKISDVSTTDSLNVFVDKVYPSFLGLLNLRLAAFTHIATISSDLMPSTLALLLYISSSLQHPVREAISTSLFRAM